MSQPIQDPTVGTALQRLFRLQGRVRPALEEFVIPTVRIADLSEGATPGVVRHAVAAFGQNGVAAQRTVWRFEIPGELIAVVRKMIVRPFTNACNLTGFFGSSIAAPANVAPKTFTDGRILLAPAQRPAGVLTSGTQVGGLGTIHYRQWLPGNVATVIVPPFGWIVGSGRAGQFGFMEWSVALDAEGVDVTLEWDEFPIF